MKVMRFGQAGLLLDTGNTKALIDPYFTDSAYEVSGIRRRIPVPPFVWDIKPDAVLFTHDHIDHYDPETARHYVNESTRVTVISPRSVWEKVIHNGGDNNYVLASPGVRWTCGDMAVSTVRAAHSDPFAVGYVFDAEGKRIYVTGDTLFSLDISLPFESVDHIFLPINGRGNNMNAPDAALFARHVNAKTATPVHYGMLDDIDPRVFEFENTFIMNDFTEYNI